MEKEEFDIFSLEYNKIVPQKGKILISEPFANDSYFKRAVVLIAEHNSDGTVGFIINKPLSYSLSEISEEFPNFEVPVSIGGPVERNKIFYIHNLGDKIPGSQQINDKLYWGGDFNVLQLMIETKAITEKDIRFFIGYSGWDKGQLETEIKNNYWLVSKIENEFVMKSDKSVWNKAVEKLGSKYNIWKNFPENPSHN